MFHSVDCYSFTFRSRNGANDTYNPLATRKAMFCCTALPRNTVYLLNRFIFCTHVPSDVCSSYFGAAAWRIDAHPGFQYGVRG